jgi:hypothetical protein
LSFSADSVSQTWRRQVLEQQAEDDGVEGLKKWPICW